MSPSKTYRRASNFSRTYNHSQTPLTEPNCNLLAPTPRTKPTNVHRATLPNIYSPPAFIAFGINVPNAVAPQWQFGLLDSGSSDNLITEATFRRLPGNKQVFVPVKDTLSYIDTADSNKLRVLGTASLHITLQSSDNPQEAVVIRATFVITNNALAQDIFIGQAFLASKLVHSESTSHLILRHKTSIDRSRTIRVRKFPMTKIAKLQQLSHRAKSTISVNQTSLRPRLSVQTPKNTPPIHQPLWDAAPHPPLPVSDGFIPPNTWKRVPTCQLDAPPLPIKVKTDAELLQECDLSHLNSENRAIAEAMLLRNMHAFKHHKLDIGKCKNVLATIPLAIPDPPNIVVKFIPITKRRQDTQDLLDAYTQAGVLAITDEPCIFTSNIFTQPKPDGALRLLYDGTVISSVTMTLPVAVGHFDELYSHMANQTILSKNDVSHAYEHIPVDMLTSRMLSFFGPNGKRYIYRRAGQGLKFSAFYLEVAMTLILAGLHHSRNYCDDTFTFSNGSFTDHVNKVEELIQSFHAHNVKLNISKIAIAPPSVDFIGLTWRKGFLHIPESRRAHYASMERPTTFAKLQFLINNAAFYRRFIPNYSEMIYPLQDTVTSMPHAQKSKPLFWDAESIKAYDDLKAALTNDTALAIPIVNSEFIVHINPTYRAATATIFQILKNGTKQTIASVSRRFTKSERNLPMQHKQLLTLIYSLNTHKYTLTGANLTVHGDIRMIYYIHIISQSTPYLARLAFQLSKTRFSFRHTHSSLPNVPPNSATSPPPVTVDSLPFTPISPANSLRIIQMMRHPSKYQNSIQNIGHRLSIPALFANHAMLDQSECSSPPSSPINTPDDPTSNHTPVSPFLPSNQHTVPLPAYGPCF